VGAFHLYPSPITSATISLQKETLLPDYGKIFEVIIWTNMKIILKKEYENFMKECINLVKKRI